MRYRKFTVEVERFERMSGSMTVYAYTEQDARNIARMQLRNRPAANSPVEQWEPEPSGHRHRVISVTEEV